MNDCVIVGPYLPVGDVEWTCRTHNVEVVLREDARADAAASGRELRRDDFECPAANQKSELEELNDDELHDLLFYCLAQDQTELWMVRKTLVRQEIARRNVLR